MACFHIPLACIIPSHMVERIMGRGSPSQIENAKNNLNVSGQLRGQRHSIDEISEKAGVVSMGKRRKVYDTQQWIQTSRQPGNK